MVFRVGDSPTNIIPPLMPWHAVRARLRPALQPRTSSGTMISLMLPYAVVFLIS
jgi:aminobenzoyl-glutamate transport protein